MFKESSCIRINTIQEINNILRKNNNSIKLIGPKYIGITRIMKCIYNYCTPGGEWSNDYFSLYIDNNYEKESFVNQLHNQLKLQNFKTITLTSNNLIALCLEATEIVKKRWPHKKVVFIFDDFQKNFYNPRKDNKTLLTEKAIREMSSYEQDQNIIFIVNYTIPTEPLLNTDWYLKGFNTVSVDLLSEDEAKKLVVTQRHNNNLNAEDSTIKKILYYGGRHPEILNIAARYYQVKNQTELENLVRKRFKEIVDYIIKEETKLTINKNNIKNHNFSTIEQLKEHAKYPLKQLVDLDNELLKGYTYSKEGKFHVFSDYFANYLNPTTESDSIHFLKLIMLIVTSFLIAPIIFSFVLNFVQPLTNRVLFIPEFDHYGFNFSYIQILLTYLGITDILSLVYSINILLLITLVIKGEPITLWPKRKKEPWRRNKNLSQIERVTKIYLTAPFYFLFLILMIFLTSIPTVFQIAGDLTRNQAPDVVISTLKTYDNFLSTQNSPKSINHLRKLWVNHSTIAFDIFSKEYLAITPLVLSIENNFPSAIGLASRYLMQTYQEYFGINPSTIFRDENIIISKIQEIIEYGDNKNAINYQLDILTKDFNSSELTRVLSESIEYINPSIIIKKEQFENFYSQDRKMAAFIYVNLKAGINCYKIQNSDDLLKFSYQLMTRIIKKYS